MSATEEPETTRSAVTPDFDKRQVLEHDMSAYSFALMAEFATTHAARQLGKAAAIVDRTDGIRNGLMPEENSKVADMLRRADINLERAKNYQAIAERHAVAVTVKSEPRVYGPHSRNSWYMDLAAVAVPGDLTGAAARLERYSRELSVEAKAGSVEGRRALDVVSSRSRSAGEDAVENERRAMSSGATSGGSFVTPQYVVDHQFALFNSYPPSFIEQTTKVPDAGYGMELYVPAFGSASTVAQQMTENSGVTDTSPTASYLSTALVTFAGEVDVSQQFFDRAGPVGADVVIHAALAQQLQTEVNLNAITQAIAGGGTVTGAGSFTAANFLGDISKAKMQMETTAGTRLPATHVFMQPDFYSWSIAQMDPNGRPLLLPANSNAVLPIQAAADGSPPVGFTGERLGEAAVFTDGSIPNASTPTQTQIIVANAADVLTMTSEPVVRAFVESDAQDLTVIIQLYALTGCIVRHGTSVQVISGAAYLSAPTFA
jgi:HK97 family phage major capsid protein